MLMLYIPAEYWVMTPHEYLLWMMQFHEVLPSSQLPQENHQDCFENQHLHFHCVQFSMKT